MKYLTLIAVLTTILFTSCSKDEIEPSTLTLLTDNGTKSWRVTQLTINGEIRSDVCESDDIFTFELYNEETESTRFKIEDNVFSCDLNEDYITDSGTWRLNNKENRITFVLREEFEFIDGNNQNQEVSEFQNLVFDIDEISQSRLVLRSYLEWNEFDIEVYTYTLTEI